MGEGQKSHIAHSGVWERERVREREKDRNHRQYDCLFACLSSKVRFSVSSGLLYVWSETQTQERNSCLPLHTIAVVNKILCPRGMATTKDDSTDSVQFFEGVEKLLEIWFTSSSSINRKQGDLRQIPQ